MKTLRGEHVELLAPRGTTAIKRRAEGERVVIQAARLSAGVLSGNKEMQITVGGGGGGGAAEADRSSAVSVQVKAIYARRTALQVASAAAVEIDVGAVHGHLALSRVGGGGGDRITLRRVAGSLDVGVEAPAVPTPGTIIEVGVQGLRPWWVEVK